MAKLSNCFVCGEPLDCPPSPYVTCKVCGHHHATGAGVSGAVDNDLLDRARAVRLDALTRAQVKLTAATALTHRSLLDVGSGTGKFLYHARECFDRVVGVEVSAPSVRFATEGLGLEVFTDVAQTEGLFDVVTSWHALEHIPSTTLHGLLRNIRARCHENSKVILCVPNPDSLLARLLGGRWAFRDVECHLHEFSRRSLDKLMNQAGFRPERSHRIFSYTLFAWVQSLANLCPLPHNYIYYRLKRGWTFGRRRTSLLSTDALGALCLLPAIVVGGTCALADHVLAGEITVHTVTYSPILSP